MNYPPRLSEDFDYKAFSSGFNDIADEKSLEVIEQMDALDHNLSLWARAIDNCKSRGELDEFGVYFFSLWSALQYGDYDILQKWLVYWMTLSEKMSDKPRRIIPDNFKEIDVESIKMYRLIESYYQGQLRGSVRLTGKCPFHEERTGSFFIFTNSNTYHCFGCGLGGDVIDFVMRQNSLTFQEAIKFLS